MINQQHENTAQTLQQARSFRIAHNDIIIAAQADEAHDEFISQLEDRLAVEKEE